MGFEYYADSKNKASREVKTMKKLLIATGNQGKLLEIQALLADLGLILLTPADLRLNLQVDEVGKTYAENAVLKAVTFAKAGGLLTMADDSGLEVEALGGLPGIRSARFAPQAEATDADRRAYLLKLLSGLPRPWRACFRCTVALATPQGQVHTAEGWCPGEIIPQERGQNGFGYDPIFLLPELGQTMAELTMEVKNRLSHRGRAVLAARPLLQEMLA